MAVTIFSIRIQEAIINSIETCPSLSFPMQLMQLSHLSIIEMTSKKKWKSKLKARTLSYFKIASCNRITIINLKTTKTKEKAGLGMEVEDLYFWEQAPQLYKVIKTSKVFKESTKTGK